MLRSLVRERRRASPTSSPAGMPIASPLARPTDRTRLARAVPPESTSGLLSRALRARRCPARGGGRGVAVALVGSRPSELTCGSPTVPRVGERSSSAKGGSGSATLESRRDLGRSEGGSSGPLQPPAAPPPVPAASSAQYNKAPPHLSLHLSILPKDDTSSDPALTSEGRRNLPRERAAIPARSSSPPTFDDPLVFALAVAVLAPGPLRILLGA